MAGKKKSNGIPPGQRPITSFFAAKPPVVPGGSTAASERPLDNASSQLPGPPPLAPSQPSFSRVTHAVLQLPTFISQHAGRHAPGTLAMTSERALHAVAEGVAAGGQDQGQSATSPGWLETVRASLMAKPPRPLNAQQQAAADAAWDEALLILAGAGTSTLFL